ncbi:hypothetical protein LUZ63_008733 [Rhynchospora breviuscula]|uniref:HMG box domain-containing protein n=1 Tax=Rhynchospora breviuscula TaxID=2022672 RepID=A0A9Q0CU81_9POAL|nr:hypothetical protein LUZ63_008733 [Rhynchospora breviuscula]
MGRPKKAESQAAGKRKAAAPKKISKKAKKDPNKPKRPSSAFFVFMNSTRRILRTRALLLLAKLEVIDGSLCQKLTKAPYVAKVEKHKDEYNKKMDAYNKVVIFCLIFLLRAEKSSGRSKDEDEEEEQAEGSKFEVEDEEEDEPGILHEVTF